MARRHFAGVHLAAASTPAPGSGPNLCVANHTNWWDGFLAVLATAHFGLDFQVLMEAAHLNRYPIFRRVGALQMRRESAALAYADLEAASLHLQRPATALWIFPQGRRRPALAPISGTERGAAQLALGAGVPVTVWPVAFRYAYLGEQVPEAFIWVGEPWQVASAGAGRVARGARRELSVEIERRMQLTVDAIDARLRAEQLDDFVPLVRGRRSVNKRLDRVRHLLGTLEGPFVERNG